MNSTVELDDWASGQSNNNEPVRRTTITPDSQRSYSINNKKRSSISPTYRRAQPTGNCISTPVPTPTSSCCKVITVPHFLEFSKTPGFRSFDQSLYNLNYSGFVHVPRGSNMGQKLKTIAKIQLLAFVLGLFGFVVSSELIYHYVTLEHGECIPVSQGPAWVAALASLGQILVTVASVTMVAMAFKYHSIRIKETGLMHCDVMARRERIQWMILEMLVCSFHIPPGVHQCFGETLNLVVATPTVHYSIQTLNVFLLLRSYVILRYLFFSGRFSRTTGRVILNLHHQRKNFSLVIKDILFKHPVQVFVLLYFGTILTFAYIVMLFERSTQMEMQALGLRFSIPSYGECCWYIWKVASTFGLSDWYPISIYSRWATVIVGVFGLMMSSMLVALVMSNLQLSPEEKKMSTTLSLLRNRAQVPEFASRLIAAWWNYAKMRNRNHSARQKYLTEISHWNRLRRKLSTLENVLQSPLSHSDVVTQLLEQDKRQQTLEKTLSKMEGMMEALCQNRQVPMSASPSGDSGIMSTQTVMQTLTAIQSQVSSLNISFRVQQNEIYASLSKLEDKSNQMMKQMESRHSHRKHRSESKSPADTPRRSEIDINWNSPRNNDSNNSNNNNWNNAKPNTDNNGKVATTTTTTNNATSTTNTTTNTTNTTNNTTTNNNTNDNNNNNNNNASWTPRNKGLTIQITSDSNVPSSPSPVLSKSPPNWPVTAIASAAAMAVAAATNSNSSRKTPDSPDGPFHPTLSFKPKSVYDSLRIVSGNGSRGSVGSSPVSTPRLIAAHHAMQMSMKANSPSGSRPRTPTLESLGPLNSPRKQGDPNA